MVLSLLKGPSTKLRGLSQPIIIGFFRFRFKIKLKKKNVKGFSNGKSLSHIIKEKFLFEFCFGKYDVEKCFKRSSNGRWPIKSF